VLNPTLNPRLYTVEFMAESGRYYSVTGTDMLLQDLCMGPHVRQREQQEFKKATGDEFKIDPPRGNGEIKGCRLRFGRVRPPFSINNKGKKDAA
jgi:hypothetical protein